MVNVERFHLWFNYAVEKGFHAQIHWDGLINDSSLQELGIRSVVGLDGKEMDVDTIINEYELWNQEV